MNILLEVLFQKLVEGYKEAQTEFAAASDPTTATQLIDMYKELVNRNQVQGNERNIDWWRKQGWEQFKNFVNTKSATKSITQIKRSKVLGKSITIFENQQWLIVIPLDKDASCFHGKNTDWCTTKPHTHHFEEYFYDNAVTLIYFLKLDSGEKWAIAFNPTVDTIECFDINDRSLSTTSFKRQTGFDPQRFIDLAIGQNHINSVDAQRHVHKLTIEFLRSQLPFTVKSDEIKQGLLATKQLHMISQYLVVTGRDNQLEKILFNSSAPISVEYLSQIEAFDPNLSVERTILRDIDQHPFDYPKLKLAVEYTIKFKHQRWLELENRLLDARDKNLIDLYQRELVVGDWVDDEQSASPQTLLQHALDTGDRLSATAERTILLNSTTAIRYAKHIKRARWPEAEQMLIKQGDPAMLLSYATVVIDDRWPEAESIIITNPAVAIRYAHRLLPDRWPEAENTILANSSTLIDYCTTIVGGRWPEGERALIARRDVKGIVAYVVNVLHGKRWREVESILLAGELDICLDYAMRVGDLCIAGWPELEHLITTDTSLVLDYVLKVTKSRFEAGEPILNLSGTAKQGYEYSNTTLFRWGDAGYSEMESRIANSQYAAQYGEIAN